MSDQQLQAATTDEQDAMDGEPAEITALDVIRLVFLRRWWLVGAGVAGFLFAVVPRLTMPYAYKATASFTAKSSDNQKSNLSSIASSFGVSLPSANQGQSPQFYADLLTSRAVLANVIGQTFPDPETGKGTRTLQELFEIKGVTPEYEREMSVDVVAGTIKTDLNRNTGVVRVSVITPWRSISTALLDAILRELNAFNLNALQSQATAERRFVEGRLALAKDSLRAAENRLESFLRSNRQASFPPELRFIEGRLTRDVALDQQVASALAQALEDARIREVRDTPVISIIEAPAARYRPESRGRLRRGMIGFGAGALGALVLLLLGEFAERKRAAGDPLVIEILRQLAYARSKLPGWLTRRTNRSNQ